MICNLYEHRDSNLAQLVEELWPKIDYISVFGAVIYKTIKVRSSDIRITPIEGTEINMSINERDF